MFQCFWINGYSLRIHNQIMKTQFFARNHLFNCIFIHFIIEVSASVAEDTYLLFNLYIVLLTKSIKTS